MDKAFSTLFALCVFNLFTPVVASTENNAKKLLDEICDRRLSDRVVPEQYQRLSETERKDLHALLFSEIKLEKPEESTHSLWCLTRLKGPYSREELGIIRDIYERSPKIVNGKTSFWAENLHITAARTICSVDPNGTADLVSELGKIYGEHFKKASPNEYDIWSFESTVESIPDQNRKLFSAAFDRHFRWEPQFKDACSSLCKTVESSSKWATSEVFDQPMLWQYGQESWNFSMRLLQLYFLEKASPYCPEFRGAVEKVRTAFLSDLSNAFTKSNSTLTRKAPIDESTMKSLGIEPDSIQRVLEFTENLQLDKANLPPVKESTHLYGKIFGSRLLREWLQTSRVGAGQVRDVESLSAQFQMSVEDDLRLTIRSDNFNASDVGSSYLTTYAFSMYLNLAQPPDSKLIEKAIRIHALLGDQPLEVPYYPRRPTKSDKETKRGASARAVPFYLALYRTVNTPEQKDRFRRILLDAIVNFSQYSPDLSLHALRGRTSTGSGSSFHMGSDQIAPYYYFPNLPFATAAIELLLRDNNLTPDERKTLISTKENILQRILMMQNQDGTFRLVYDGIAKSSGAYTNPLAGLALVSLIEECNGKQMKPSLGIIENSSLQENTNSQRKLNPHNSKNSHAEAK